MSGVIAASPRRPDAAARYASSYSLLLAQVRAAGLLRRRSGRYAAMFAAALAGCALVSGGVAALGNSWFQLLCAAGAAVLVAQIGFLAHDAAHRQVFRAGAANERAARLLAAAGVGLSYGWWMRKHTRHHQAPNQLGRDPDIGPGLVAFTEPAAAAKPQWAQRAWLPRQGWAFIPLLLLEGLHLHVASVRELLAPGPAKRRIADAGLIAARLGGFALALWLTLPAGKAAAFAGVYLAVLGLCLGGAFAPNHTGMPILGHDAKIDFLTRQVSSSRNISGGLLVRFAMGGLDRQIEHHLFPSMPRPNLRRAAPMVREFCRAHGLAYTETTLAQAYRQIIRYLNTVGLGARRGASCPLAAALR